MATHERCSPERPSSATVGFARTSVYTRASQASTTKLAIERSSLESSLFLGEDHLIIEKADGNRAKLKVRASDTISSIKEAVSRLFNVAPARQLLCTERGDQLQDAERDALGHRRRHCIWSDLNLPNDATILLTDFTEFRPSLKAIPRVVLPQFRGVTLSQLRQFLAFVKKCRYMKRGALLAGWCDLDPESLYYRQALTYDSFNHHHASRWIIRPATSCHRCSFVEFLAPIPEAVRRPQWFVSHSWGGETIVKFVRCLEVHVSIRSTSETAAAFWASVFCSSQHELGMELSSGWCSNSFHLAMRQCDGVLLLMGQNAEATTRTWCCFEMLMALEHSGRRTPPLLDIAAVAEGTMSRVALLTEGLTKNEQETETNRGAGTGWRLKAQREEGFPTQVIREALDLDILSSRATRCQDTRRLLNIVANRPRLQLDHEPDCNSKAYDEANAELRSVFALAGLRNALVRNSRPNRPEIAPFCNALKADGKRKLLHLSLQSCPSLDDAVLCDLIGSLPAHLTLFQLDVMGCFSISCEGLEGLVQALPSTLTDFSLNITGCSQAGDRWLCELSKAVSENGRLKRLKRLHLELQSTRISDAGIESLAFPFADALEALKLGLGKARPAETADFISDIGVRTLVERLPSSLLQLELDLTNTNITDKSIEEIACWLPQQFIVLKIIAFGTYVQAELMAMLQRPHVVRAMLQWREDLKAIRSPGFSAHAPTNFAERASSCDVETTALNEQTRALALSTRRSSQTQTRRDSLEIRRHHSTPKNTRNSRIAFEQSYEDSSSESDSISSFSESSSDQESGPAHASDREPVHAVHTSCPEDAATTRTDHMTGVPWFLGHRSHEETSQLADSIWGPPREANIGSSSSLFSATCAAERYVSGLLWNCSNKLGILQPHEASRRTRDEKYSSGNTRGHIDRLEPSAFSPAAFVEGDRVRTTEDLFFDDEPIHLQSNIVGVIRQTDENGNMLITFAVDYEAWIPQSYTGKLVNATLVEGDRILTTRSLLSNADLPQVAVNSIGVIQRIGEHGDALIRFSGISHDVGLSKSNMWKIIEAPLIAEDRVRTMETFPSNDEEPIQVAANVIGIVHQIDETGDALIGFAGIEQDVYVQKANLWLLQKAGEADASEFDDAVAVHAQTSENNVPGKLAQEMNMQGIVSLAKFHCSGFGIRRRPQTPSTRSSTPVQLPLTARPSSAPAHSCRIRPLTANTQRLRPHSAAQHGPHVVCPPACPTSGPRPRSARLMQLASGASSDSIRTNLRANTDCCSAASLNSHDLGRRCQEMKMFSRFHRLDLCRLSGQDVHDLLTVQACRSQGLPASERSHQLQLRSDACGAAEHIKTLSKNIKASSRAVKYVSGDFALTPDESELSGRRKCEYFDAEALLEHLGRKTGLHLIDRFRDEKPPQAMDALCKNAEADRSRHNKIDMDEIAAIANASQMSVEDALQCRRVFDSYDIDQSGTISKTELEAVVAQLMTIQMPKQSIPLAHAKGLCRQFWKQRPEGAASELDFMEFATWYSAMMRDNRFRTENQRLQEIAAECNISIDYAEYLKKSFDAYSNDAGVIDMDGFQKILYKAMKITSQDDPLPRSRIKSLWYDLDPTGCCEVVFEYFLRWWLPRFYDESKPDKLQPLECFYKLTRATHLRRNDPPIDLVLKQQEAESSRVSSSSPSSARASSTVGNKVTRDSLDSSPSGRKAGRLTILSEPCASFAKKRNKRASRSSTPATSGTHKSKPLSRHTRSQTRSQMRMVTIKSVGSTAS